jgi:arabinogalactan endo-1,4-beta-galactosidase
MASPASALFGEAEIQPVESNLAGKSWVSASASSGGSTAALAVDQDPDTAWIATEPGPGQWLALDLGGGYDNLRKVHVAFLDPGAVYQYVVEVSADGQRWRTIADRSGNATPGRGAVDLFTQPGTRHVRVTITGASPGATVGVSELEVFNYLRDELILGADLSWVDNFQTREYWVHPLEPERGVGPELLDVVQDRGMEYVRLRIFNEPRSESSGDPTTTPFQGPERSLVSAQWVKQRGLGLGIDFHYADSWADPGKQPKPRAWAELEFDDLVDALYDFTYDYISQLVAQGTTPDKVAIGNEIANGFLWGSEAVEAPPTDAVHAGANPPYFRDQPEIYQSQPGGGILWQYLNSEDPNEHLLYLESWDRFTTLLAAGIAAVRAASPETEVELHSIVGRVSGLAKALEYWDQLVTRVNAKGQDFDVLALSYYPEWHGTIEQMELNLHTLATVYPQYKLEIAETAYPATGGGTQPNSTYPRTIQGQADAIQHVFQIVNDIIDNRGVGVLTWEPAGFQAMFRSVPGMPNIWEPYSSIDIYNESRATHILADTVHVTTLLGQAPALPATVGMLTTADGSVQPVPVQWEQVGTPGSPGQLTVQGSTGYGEVTALVDVVAELSRPDCDTVLTGRHTGPLTVSTGVTCLNGATVVGPVTIQPGAGLQADGARITGPVTAHGPGVVILCGTELTGPVGLTGGASVTVGDPVLDCAPNRVTGPVTVRDTSGWNVIAGNTITGPLACSGNQPPPVDNGATNQVQGPKSGQCRGL